MKRLPLITTAIISTGVLSGCASGPGSEPSGVVTRAEYVALHTQYQQADQARMQVLEENSELETLLASLQQAPVDDSLLPPNPQPGECYARVVIPAVYKTEQQTVEVASADQRIDVVPGRYEWVEEQVLVKEAHTHIEVVPATYKTVTEQVLVQEAATRLEKIPARYETVTEQILIKPAHTIWKKGRGPIERIDAATGEIMCLVEVPAEYQTVTRQVLAEPEQIREVEIPAQYTTVEQRMIDTPETTREVVTPAVYETVRVKRLAEAPSQRVVDIPAQYETVSQRVKVADARLEWRSILCETNTHPGIVTDIQQALNSRGYNPGPIDGVIGRETMAAVEAYQQANQLPVGQLTIQTLKSLGVQ